ncbi:MAG: acetate--CoA ligase family protein [Syntrophorhabdus sp.]
MTNKDSAKIFNALFRPRSIVIVGGSESLSKPGGTVLANIVEHHYDGELKIVNPGGAVLGLPTFPSISELPETPELAIIAIPAKFVAQSLEDLGQKGTKAVIILSAGFGEKGEEGKKEEKKLLAIADRFGMTLIGPNCSGFMTPHYSGKFAGIIPELKPHSIDFISGSGATVDLVMEQADLRGLSFCNVVNVGNSIQIGVEDLIALYDDNYGEEGSPILFVYLENLRKPRIFLNHARSLTQKGCTIIAIKSGVSVSGARAAASHTGAMATDDTAVKALFDKAGIIRVKSKMEMIDVACALTGVRGTLTGRHACVITDAGGTGIMLTDELERQGFTLPVLGEKAQERLKSILPAEASVLNPIDCLPSRTPLQMRQIFQVLAEEESRNLNVICIQVGNPGIHPNNEIYREVSDAMKVNPIPVVPTLSSVKTCTEWLREFTGGGNFYFVDEVNCASALGKLLRKPIIYGDLPHLPNYDHAGIAGLIQGKAGILDVDIVTGVLEKAGFRFPAQTLVRSYEDLRGACDGIGYPLAMKVVGPLHKSDLGGVRLNIRFISDAEAAWHDLMEIAGAQGVVIQRMIEGTEAILGATRAHDMGHLVMFGLGGIYTEVLKDVSFALAPLANEECHRMIKSIRAYPILKGIRGQAGVEENILAENIARLSRLVFDFPQISELDINPLKGSGNEVYVVDARIIL